MVCLETKTEQETIAIGKLIAKCGFPGAVILLDGDLGAGKTTLTGGIALGLGIEEKVMSPTFNILRCYFHARIPLYHIDAYRLEEGTNRDIGLEEFIEGDGICVIEWPQMIQEWLPMSYLSIQIQHEEGTKRRMTIDCQDVRFIPLLQALKEEFLCTESF